MTYLCPLCLESIAEDGLERFCLDHPDKPGIRVGAEDAIACSVPGCRSHHRVGAHALLLRHVDCTRGLNPFWNGSALDVKDRIASPVDGTQVILGHWQVAALRTLAARRPEREMWFPAALLLDSADRRPRTHVRVSLTGAKSVGKTFFAMHALDAEGYPQGPGPFEDFIYCFPSGEGAAAADEYLLTLGLREQMALNQQFQEWLRATDNRPRNLKAAFFGSLPARSSSAPRFRAARWLAIAAREVFGVFKEIFGSERIRRNIDRVLLLYDISGEDARTVGAPMAVEHDREMDVLAILISAHDLLESAPFGQTLDLAANRLRTAHGARVGRRDEPPRCCLIVTKCDEVTDAPRSEEGLIAVLKTLGLRNPSARSLAVALGGGRGGPSIDRAFFAWPKDGLHGQAAPQICGLSDFVNWCFEG